MTSKRISPLGITDHFFGERLVSHAGQLIVSSGAIAFLPGSRIGVAVLTNGNGYSMPGLAKVALAIMLGHAPEELSFERH